MTPNKQYMDRISRLRRGEERLETELPQWMLDIGPCIALLVGLGMVITFIALRWA